MTLKVSVPLSDFDWYEDSDFEIPGIGTIIRTKNLPIRIEDEAWEYSLSKDDISELETSHWLIWEQAPDDELSTKARMNIFQLALWLANPTSMRIKYRFEQDGADKTFSRVLDRFHCHPGEINTNIESAHLQEASNYVSSLCKICNNKKRLIHALDLTLQGCFALKRNVRFVLFGTAAETILNYGKSNGVTEALAEAYALLVTGGNTKEEFKKMYDVRSDIVHGRVKKLNDDNKNIENALKFETMIRELWKNIIAKDEYVESLEKSNDSRKKFFSSLKSL